MLHIAIASKIACQWRTKWILLLDFTAQGSADGPLADVRVVLPNVGSWAAEQTSNIRAATSADDPK
jgi:hypothetical protein